MTVGSKERELIDSFGHRHTVERQHHGGFGIDRVGAHHPTVVDERVAQQFAHHRRRGIDGRLNRIVLQHVDLHGKPFIFGIGQTHIVVVALAVGKTQILGSSIWTHDECTPAVPHRGNSSYLPLLCIQQAAAGFEAGAGLVSHREGHPIGQSLDEFSTFGIEAHLQAILLIVLTVIQAHTGQTLTIAIIIHHHLRVVTILGGSLKHREDPREDAAIAPVGHVASVGAHLVEARRVEAVECHVTVCRTILNGQLTRQHHIARRIDQLHIQYRTHVGRLARVGAQHIALEPDGFTHEVTRVVEVEIHFLLRHSLRKVHGALHIRNHAHQLVVVCLSHRCQTNEKRPTNSEKDLFQVCPKCEKFKFHIPYYHLSIINSQLLILNYLLPPVSVGLQVEAHKVGRSPAHGRSP